MIDKYIKFFKEAFVKGQVERAIDLTNKIISRKLGVKIYTSSLPDEVKKSGVGIVYGIFSILNDGRQLRYNWRQSDSSQTIVSIDVWNSVQVQPDFTIETEGMNIIKIIDAIVFALTNNKVGIIKLEEDSLSQTKFSVNKGIAEIIKQWATAMDVTDDKLKNTRISYLYNDYKYWNDEISKGAFKLISYGSFRNYLLDYMKKNNIENIFMRSITIKKANKEVLVNTDDPQSQQIFDKSIYEMSLADKIGFLKTSIRAVLRGYENCLIIAGMAGIGKSKTVRDIIFEENVSPRWIQGEIRNFESLYKLFYDNKSKKSVIVFDDVDSILTKKYLPIMNAALAPESKRIISYPMDFVKKLPEGYKDEFLFEGKIIIITNIPKQKIPSSLASRGAVIEIKIKSEDIIDYIRMNIDDVMKDYKQATREIKLEVLDFIEKIKKNITQVDFRLFKRCCVYRLSGDPAWKKYCIPILGLN